MGKYMKRARKKLRPPFKPCNDSSNPRKPLPFRRSASVASAAGNPNQRHQNAPELESGDGNMPELTHGYATQASSKHRVLILEYPSFPSASELDQFFAAAEKVLQKQFIERYNYDTLDDCPVPGRYEWTRLD